MLLTVFGHTVTYVYTYNNIHTVSAKQNTQTSIDLAPCTMHCPTYQSLHK